MRNIPAPRIRRNRAALAAALSLAVVAPLAAQWNWLNPGANPGLLVPGDHALCCGPRGAANPDATGPNHLFATMATMQGVNLGGATYQPVSTAKESAPAAEPAKTEDGFLKVGFDQLASFQFDPPGYDASGNPQPKTGEDQIPERIRKLNDQAVAVTGFMLPVRMEEGLVKEFLLVKDPMMCCYGMMPRINEWVVVKMTGKGVKPLMDVPITFGGKLKVGEQFENGYLTGIYVLEGDKQLEAKG